MLVEADFLDRLLGHHITRCEQDLAYTLLISPNSSPKPYPLSFHLLLRVRETDSSSDTLRK